MLFKATRLNPIDTLKNLFTLKKDSHPLDFLNGTRCVLAIVVVTYHSWLYTISFPFANGENLSKIQGNVWSLIIPIYDLPINIFFIIAGFLHAKSLTTSFNNR